jgi:hypothetical protein
LDNKEKRTMVDEELREIFPTLVVTNKDPNWQFTNCT